MLILASLLQAATAKDCDSVAGDQNIAQCWSDEYERADKELNVVWKDTRQAAHEKDADFAPTQRRAKASAEVDLLEAQRAWIKFRSSECAAESDYAQGGSLQNIIAGECSTELTRERIKKLRDLAEGFREN